MAHSVWPSSKGGWVGRGPIFATMRGPLTMRRGCAQRVQRILLCLETPGLWLDGELRLCLLAIAPLHLHLRPGGW